MDKKASLKKYQEEFPPENKKLMNDDFYLIIINCFIFSLFNNKNDIFILFDIGNI